MRQPSARDDRLTPVLSADYCCFLLSTVLAVKQYPGNPEFSREHNLNSGYNIITPRCPSPRSLTNHSAVSDIGGANSIAVLPTGYRESYLLVSSAALDTSPLVFF